MGATISVGGVTITVQVSELGEAMRQIAPFLQGKNGDAVQKIPPKSTAWPFPTGKEVAPVAAPTMSPAPQPAVERQISPPNPEVLRRALNLFGALVRHRGPGGLSPPQVMDIVGADHPKGIGSRMQAINALIRSVGIEADDAYRNDRNEVGTRVWTAGPAAQEALNALVKMKG